MKRRPKLHLIKKLGKVWGGGGNPTTLTVGGGTETTKTECQTVSNEVKYKNATEVKYKNTSYTM